MQAICGVKLQGHINVEHRDQNLQIQDDPLFLITGCITFSILPFILKYPILRAHISIQSFIERYIPVDLDISFNIR